MKRRKITALLMASAMALTAFGGTGLSALADEPYTVKISFPSLVYQPSEEGVQQVEEALNAYLEEQGENVSAGMPGPPANGLRIKNDSIHIKNYCYHFSASSNFP